MAKGHINSSKKQTNRTLLLIQSHTLCEKMYYCVMMIIIIKYYEVNQIGGPIIECTKRKTC